MITVNKKQVDRGYSKRANWIVNYFQDDDVFIVGGGASLIGFDFKRLDNKRVIAINHSYRYVKHELLIYLDAKFKKECEIIGDPVEKMTCKIIAGPSGNAKESDNITVVQMTPEVSKLPDRMYGRATSALVAINAALLGKAKRIYLLGIDCKFIGGKDHFYYRDFKHARADCEIAYRRVINHFDKFKPYKNIFNCSKESLLTVFPKVNIENIL